MNADLIAWANQQFAQAELPDQRLRKRIVKMGGQMASLPGESLTKQAKKWSDVKAGYRLLSHEDVTPEGIQKGHIALTRETCAAMPVVLCIQDTTEFDFSRHKKTQGLGRIGNGGSQGFKQHSGLAVSTDGQVIGLLGQRWFLRPEAPAGETQAQCRARWNEGDLWQDMAKSVGTLGACRVIHVCDRGADISAFFLACVGLGAGCLVRASHDRRVGHAYLWDTLEKEPECGRITATVSPQANGKRTAREATLSVRFRKVRVTPAKADPFDLHAVYVREESSNVAVEKGGPVDWMLLTSEPVRDFKDAQRILGWYMHRWIIEEFHRAMKEGCRLEASQLDHADDLQRLAAMDGIVAVRLLQLRDMGKPGHPDADSPQALRAWAPDEWIRLVAAMEKKPVESMTPAFFLRAIAKQGGFLGRKCDGHPGWITIWRGWKSLQPMVDAFLLGMQTASCG